MGETGANTSEFIGTYQINFQGGENSSSDVTPEVYVAPLAMVKADQQLVRIGTLIKDGALLRKPYFLRIEKGMQTISVYDSRAQALEAYQSFLKISSGKPVVDPAAFAAQEQAKKSLEEKTRIEQAAAAAAARVKIEEDEKRRQEDLRQQAAKLSAEEQAKRKAKAVELAGEALTLFQANNTKAAEEKFNQAIELDPENNSYAFQYGVTLYRNEKYNRAVVLLDLAKGPGLNETERDFYKASAHMKMKEYEKGYALFSAIKAKNDPDFSALSSFYAGLIDYQNERYDTAKANFEYVLDNSKDPKVDQQAETYIEQIANIKRFEEMRKKSIIVNFNLGLMYDSNILSVSAANAPTDLAGYRWAYGGSFEYRPVFSEVHEFSGILAVSDMYSTDQNFKAKTEFQNTDPLVMSLTAPYKWKGSAFGKPAQLGFTPGYETIQMNADGVGPREGYMNSLITKGDGTFVMSNDWFANYALEFRRDTSVLKDVSAEENQTANKVTLSTTQTLFKNPKKTVAFISEAGLTMNMAEGDNQKYNRVDLAISYLMPVFGETTFLSRLGVGTAKYGSHLIGRSDTNYGLTLVLQNQFTETWSGNLMASILKSNSTLDGYTYDKYLLMAGVNWKNAF